jgi:hypothetical protein
MRWSSARILVCALCLIGLVLLPQTAALACVCNDAHAIWWQQQHHSGGVIGFLRDGRRGSEAGAALVAVALIGLVSGCVIKARRNRKALLTTTDHLGRRRSAGDAATPSFRLGGHIRDDPLPASIRRRTNRGQL